MVVRAAQSVKPAPDGGAVKTVRITAVDRVRCCKCHVCTLSKASDRTTAARFKDERCNSDHDDSSKTHLLGGLKAVIVEYMNTHSHMLFTGDDSQSPQAVKCRALFRMEGLFVLSLGHRSTKSFHLDTLWIHTGRENQDSSFPPAAINLKKKGFFP